MVVDGVEDVEGAEGVVRLRARPAAADGVCPRCGSQSRRVHAWHVRRLADLPVGGRAVVIELHVRRLLCQAVECPQRTFRQQVPEVALRYARRTLRLTATVGGVAVTLAGRAGAAVLAGLGMAISRSTVLRVLMALPLPPQPAPKVLSVVDFALRRGRRYATLLLDAVTLEDVEEGRCRSLVGARVWRPCSIAGGPGGGQGPGRVSHHFAAAGVGPGAV